MRNLLRAAFAFAFVFAAAKLVGCDTPVVKQLLPIGSPCTSSADCGSQPQFYCDSLHAGGYCKKDCKTDLDCPSESICAFHNSPIGQCALKCDNLANCRFTMGYTCKPASNEVMTLASHGYCGLADSDVPDGGSDDGASPPPADLTVIKDGAPRG